MRTRAELESTAMGTGSDVFQAAGMLAETAVPALADIVTVELSDLTLRGEASTPGPLCDGTALRRAAFQSVRGVRAAYAVGDVTLAPPATPYRQSLTDLRPHLVRDLKRDGRWLAHDVARARAVRETKAHSLIVVPLVVHGVVLGLVGLYRRADSAPFDVGDLRAAVSFADRAARSLDIVRGRIQERAHARLLQRALLPKVLPSLGALEAAQGHVPVEGSGGEWFDVIPLPGARAALVVGVAEGQGADSAVGMSQFRAMVIALAVQDLGPDEILARLDDVLTRLTQEQTAAGPRSSGMRYSGSSCLCVVYDPVAGHCTASGAGPSQLAVVFPDGTVTAPVLASHPPLGATGHPFEAATEVDVPSGSVLVLRSGGTDEPHSGADAELERLGEVVNRDGPDVRKIAESAHRVVSPGHEPALLVARARELGPESVASLALPPEAPAVAAARAWTSRQLTAWTLDELAFTTALVVSELLTNAILYSSGPVELRLINDDHTLICEVSDSNPAAPRLRKAKPTDEGGRGLSIVSELTQHHGMRYTAHGKTVWAEQVHPA
ncbi:ATP-binding SpoIIE family protein phosphatase [Streptomyces sp. NPDC001795]|uniref:ATP-binding SpoIIE family protein phosphatase n=1 Tax=Streptomyces sp. NPDC001795 TaxID=3154525 RepID=UPI00331AE31E